MNDLDAGLDALRTRALQSLRAAALGLSARLDDAAVAAQVAQVAVASDFALATLVRQPALLAALLDDSSRALPPPLLATDRREDWPALLRRYRAAESTRLVWRDVLGLDAVDATLAGATALAETCLRIALEALEADFATRHGVLRNADGGAQRLVVFALGKLGGGELNFSSDIDLVYGYEDDGESDGPRPLAAEPYCTRLGQQLAKLLDEATADGFCHRVDLRLRPFGNAGRVAWSFAAMEQYFQREGRDWERYAWQKARPVAGDLAAGERFLRTLRPFVYRRYLDYGALDGLREMKAAIAAEVARKDLADDIKRGPGGIREIEFLVQALQLIRGGREPALRERRLLPALQALVRAGHVAAPAGAALAEAYRFLRHLENRLQMLRDAQVHALPQDPRERARLAAALGHVDWPALRAALEVRRSVVATEFAALLAPRRRRGDAPPALAAYWRALPEAGDAQVLAAAGFDDPDTADGALRDLARAPALRALSDAARARLDRVLPALLASAAASRQPDAALRRLLPLLHNILRRASYLALLDEQPAALQRLVDVLARSALLGERLAAHPLLLDELLDVRVGGPLPQRAESLAACTAALAQEDTEAALLALNETRQALSFRIALATLDARQGAQDSVRQLAWLADAVVAVVLQLAQREMRAAHGALAGVDFAVLGYGSLGGEELGFGSDLDLVFLYALPEGAAADALQSDGARPLDAARWCARLAQKIVALLGTGTAAGRLYEVDVRLRPDGAKGLLVSPLAGYADYQRQRAWTWEHQALVRARAVAGDAALCARFEAVRAAVLAQPREEAALRADVASMRRRMRAELDRSDAARFDLKQGEGGLVDLEFLLQYLLLGSAHAHPPLLAPRATPGLLEALCAAGVVPQAGCTALRQAHATLLDAGLHCTLDRRPRLLPESAAIAAARAAIRAAWQAAGLA
ncbi:bifunctional [glutamate--ammonia ligase]-adenylyl-L-tyrosine phosphorylase/[glutamate--ammonia-ligase] adenylyltransferase [Cognatiluteimonas weifangensis]|uniref:Bifunctional glutamine synthetase adenylyltransferase/adenylyl-removing enzyme n=1 Tax=Cognatiluteimonas weifangensis TaxID=2303539 RepID=A0A372DRA6_9GAMM|nr:bifunctional [glutamate--ammonia ligase]-adenylyl-L-tyrosine phosphorylase/[glutamate--ammonia-ligase] adenylyltransferase [Luteimonas weifangensis]RFP61917.1 bifunctional [glutamate--ammonia ligase]-adenylyl-L-tyrosine phosphorylase/[glutamate--ammonia-ligase] adenylyltransferase [Luteimonas weifangensis]